MNKNLTEMVFILDRSGSMRGLEADTIGGYNSLLEKQKSEVGEAAVTTVLFDDQYEIIHDHAGITKVDPMTDREYYARGMTALLDAVGRTINHVGNRHKYAPDSEVPSKTIVVIITDGHENASSEFSLRQIKAMIEHQKSKYGWEFLFLGANIDAVSAAAGIGIAANRSVNYRADSEGTAENFSSLSDAVSSVRCAMPLGSNWKSRIEKHFRETEK